MSLIKKQMWVIFKSNIKAKVNSVVSKIVVVNSSSDVSTVLVSSVKLQVWKKKCWNCIIAS